jgi:hypothetical protein
MKSGILFGLSLFMVIVALVSFSSVRADISDSATSVLNVSLVNQNPDPAPAGEMVELRFMVENVGGKESNNVVFELIPQYPFVAIPGEDYVKTINTISAYQQGTDAIILKFRVRVDKDAVKGTNEISLKRTDPSGISITNKYDIEVSGNEFAQIIYIDKAKLEPGNETPLRFTITNVGNSPLHNLVFSWNEKNGVILPVYSDDTKYIKNIDVGKSVVLEYIVVADVNANPGLYQLDLNLKYEAQGGTSQEMITKAGIFIGGETDFDVTFSESSGGQTSISVANIGNNPALSVTVRIPNQGGFRVTGSTSSIVGNLDKGDYTIVSFQISQVTSSAAGAFNPAGSRQFPRNQSFQENASQSNDLQVQIEYTDTTGARHTLQKSVPIQFRSSDATTSVQTGNGTLRQGQNSSTLIYQIIIVLSVAIIAVVCYKKRKFLRNKLGRHSRKN